jgi:hypothetical protein
VVRPSEVTLSVTIVVPGCYAKTIEGNRLRYTEKCKVKTNYQIQITIKALLPQEQ